MSYFSFSTFHFPFNNIPKRKKRGVLLINSGNQNHQGFTDVGTSNDPSVSKYGETLEKFLDFLKRRKLTPIGPNVNFFFFHC